MKRKAIWIFSSICLILGFLISFAVNAQKKISCSEDDNKVYDGRIKQVKGKVTFLNHPTLGKTPANGMYLVFQREDCKDCLVATHADLEGNFKIFVGLGKYKLIVQENVCDYGGTGYDCNNLLAPNQPQYINVDRTRSDYEDFNIDLVLSKK